MAPGFLLSCYCCIDPTVFLFKTDSHIVIVCHQSSGKSHAWSSWWSRHGVYARELLKCLESHLASMKCKKMLWRPGLRSGPRCGSLQRSPDSLAGGEELADPLPRTPRPLSAFQASGFGTSDLAGPPHLSNPKLKFWLRPWFLCKSFILFYFRHILLQMGQPLYSAYKAVRSQVGLSLYFLKMLNWSVWRLLMRSFLLVFMCLLLSVFSTIEQYKEVAGIAVYYLVSAGVCTNSLPHCSSPPVHLVHLNVCLCKS